MIFIRLAGGLGNQLFQLAAALYLQKKTNMQISFYTEHLKNYETPREFMLQEVLPKEFPIKFLKPNFFVQNILKYRINKACPALFKWSIKNSNILLLKQSKFYVLDDYFQDISLFKKELQLVANFIQQAAINNSKVESIYSSNEYFKNAVAVHIRRGDFLNKTNASVFCVQDNEYYTTAIASISNVKKVYVFSETPVLDLVNDINLPVEMVDNKSLSDIDSFLLMSLFPNLIIANSTYSFWAAVAAKGRMAPTEIIAPKRWYHDENQNNIWLNNLSLLQFTTVTKSSEC